MFYMYPNEIDFQLRSPHHKDRALQQQFRSEDPSSSKRRIPQPNLSINPITVEDGLIPLFLFISKFLQNICKKITNLSRSLFLFCWPRSGHKTFWGA